MYESSRGIYGSAKFTLELRNSLELDTASRNTVAREMREMGLKSHDTKQFRLMRAVADLSRQTAANLLNQEFCATGPSETWVADIT